jgi:8-oxo-dGTP pyrophosphatase MutT (NUDIX family)
MATARVTVAVVAAVVLLRKDGATLMQLRDDKPGLRHAAMWVPPGGHCEPGESPLACARREFHEETGYRCGDLQWLTAVLDSSAEGLPPHWLEVFWAEYDGVQPLHCFEGQEVRFLERGRAESYPIPAFLIDIWDQALAAMKRRASGES